MSEIERPVTAQVVADHLKVAASTVDRWRREGKGPPYMRIGNRCMYFLSEVQDWLETQKVSPNGKPRKGSSLFGS